MGLIDPPAQITIHKGAEIGRPGVPLVGIPAGVGVIRVSGSAVSLDR